MSLTKSPTPFVIYYNITYKVCIFLQYHLISYSCAGHVVPPLNISYSMLYMTPPQSMLMISPINIPIFISQPLFLLLLSFITWVHVCMLFYVHGRPVAPIETYSRWFSGFFPHRFYGTSGVVMFAYRYHAIYFQGKLQKHQISFQFPKTLNDPV